MEEEIFRVEINDEGRQTFQRLKRLSLLVLIGTLVYGFIQTASSLYAFAKALRFSADHKTQLNYYMAMGYVVVSLLLQGIQIIVYRRFVTTAVRCLEHNDSTGFNRTLRLLNVQAICFLLQIGLSLLFIATRLTALF